MQPRVGQGLCPGLEGAAHRHPAALMATTNEVSILQPSPACGSWWGLQRSIPPWARECRTQRCWLLLGVEGYVPKPSQVTGSQPVRDQPRLCTSR